MSLPTVDPQPCRGKFRGELWTNTNWWAEQKFHGCRYLLYSDGRLLSRCNSVKGTGYVDKIDRVPHLLSASKYLDPGTILDGEIVTTDFGTVRDVTSILGSDPELAIYKQETRGKLRYKVFDIPFHKGIDLRNEPLSFRRNVLEDFFNRVHIPGLYLTDIVVYGKKQFCDQIMEKGGEGVVLKWKGSKYGEKKYWVKVKRSETFDVFIIGYKAAEELSQKVSGEVSVTRYHERGWIGAVEIGQFTPEGSRISVGFCSGFDEQIRAFISNHKEECLGRVFEIEAQSQLESGKFENPRFIRWREDKSPSGCVVGQN